MDSDYCLRPVLLDARDLVWRGQQQSGDGVSESGPLLDVESRLYVMRKGLVAALLVCALAGLGIWAVLHRQPAQQGRTGAPELPPGATQPVTRIASVPPGTNSRTGVPVPASSSPPIQPSTSPAPSAAAVPLAPVTGSLLFGGPDSAPVTIPP